MIIDIEENDVFVKYNIIPMMSADLRNVYEGDVIVKKNFVVFLNTDNVFVRHTSNSVWNRINLLVGRARARAENVSINGSRV